MLRRTLTSLAVGVPVALVLFIALEVVLRALGLGAPPDASAVYSGFDEGAAYLVADPEHPGSWRTQFWEGAEEELVIPPAGDRERVLFLGGSNVRYFRSGNLEGRLQQEAGAARFEVLNLGRNAYGSERVSLIFRQAMEHLEPDLVVLYVGDLEFIESRARPDRGAQRRAERLEVFPGFLRGLHTVNALTALSGGRADAPDRTPERWEPRYAEFRDQTPDETLAHLETLRANLREMCAAALEQDVRVVLCTIVYNRFSAPNGTAYPRGMTGAAVEEFERHRGEALALLPGFLGPLLPEYSGDRVYVQDWGPDVRGPTARPDHLLPGRRECLGPLARQDPILTEPSSWDPKIPALFEALEQLHARNLDEGALEDLARAEALLERSLLLCPDHPRALFELALVTYLLERDEGEVARLFELAAASDRMQPKGSDTINGIIRAVAAEHPGVCLFDADAGFGELMPGGLTGWEWMLDHSHPNGGARVVLMAGLARRILECWPQDS